MARKIRKIQSSLTAGQLSPDMAGRVDTKHFYAGARKILNMLLKPTGGATRRPGLTKIAELTDITADEGDIGIYIEEHRFNKDQTYLIMDTHNRCQVFHQDAQVWEDTNAPWTGKQANDIWQIGALDTALKFHGDMQPQSLLRNGAHDDWTLSAKAFENIPQHKFDDLDEDMWSQTRGWPAIATFHGDRLYCAASPSLPGKIGGSVVAEYFNFDEGEALDDEAVVFQANADEADPITVIYSQKYLLTFTGGSEFATLDHPVTPTKASSIRQSRNGAARIKPVSVERGVLYISNQRGNEKQALLECLYAGEADQAFDVQDLSLLAGDLIVSPVQDMALRRGNEDDRAMHVFVINGDGSCATLNTLRSQDITGWSHLNSLGGSGSDKIIRVAVVGSDVYFVTERTIGGVVRYFLEKMEHGTWLDCSKTVTAEAETTTFTGFEHLAGETVRVYANDGDRGVYTIAQDGTLELGFPALSVEVGYPYDWEIETMPFQVDLPDGTSFLSIQRVVATEVSVKETAEFYVNGRLQQFRKFGDGMLDQGLPLHTGSKRITLLGYDKEGIVRVHGAAPGPVTIQSILREVAI